MRDQEDNHIHQCAPASAAEPVLPSGVRRDGFLDHSADAAMTGPWQAARHNEEKDDSSQWKSASMDGDQAGFPKSSISGVGHNPTVTDIEPGGIVSMPTVSVLPPKWPPLQLTTLSKSTKSNTAMHEYSGSPTPNPLSTGDYTSSSPTGANGYPHKQPGSKDHPPTSVKVMVPIVLAAIIGALIFFCMRKRKKQKQIAAAQAAAQEMKARNPTVHPYVSSSLPTPRPLSRSTPSTNPSPTSPTIPQPVILGPISGSNSNYFTGIDTSDVVSVRSSERTGLGNPFADSNSLNEEPPPPYYPRSIAPLSRDTSLRVSQPPPPAWSQTELITTAGQPVRSPFDDPTDDDAVSVVSEPTARQDRDDLSAVSDLSYQQDPVVERPSV